MSFAATTEIADARAKSAGIVVDAKTGKVLYSEDPDGLRYPASLTKMMTLYLTFEALEAGRLKLDSPVPVSAHAAAEPPSKLGVRPGGSVTVEQAILALVTRSANDMATALAEKIAGNDGRFAQMMTAKARALGMTRTTYRNANGLPNTAQMTTARDQARLGIALRQHFPQYYGYFSTRSFRFGKQVIGNHNRLVGTVRGVDGIKTGYTNAAGFNLVTSAQADGRSIVAVVLGGTSGGARDAQMRRLVATYMPKASQGAASPLIAQTRSPARVVAAAAPVPVEPAQPVAEARQTVSKDLPNSGPVPSARYDERLPGASAYASEPKQRGAADAMNAAMGRQPTQMRAPVPPAAIPQKVSALETQDTDSLTTASTRPASASQTASSDAPSNGWVVQIGVSPSKDGAMDLLQSAQEKGGQVLRSAKPFAVAVNTSGSQMYRARFGGFDDQKAAVNACNTLKKKGVQCWASLQ
ncbi:D-alanyl-D-alanine carboxypeptidase [Rhizobium oryzicola]|uniref:D-alanyl-D-alanine carboxypeptidase n=1 Tax=Rhizobium oryzicola TaxID=1232668 RepID=A0ABT8SZN4_9HYPH|nr:D-alanyl-D-alanine carboxypeptidase [Rhizobium oryzicola]MDO1583730.1 D-alanyl-D-alanine carboxypeptidase [Rhizobium oryzicola]